MDARPRSPQPEPRDEWRDGRRSPFSGMRRSGSRAVGIDRNPPTGRTPALRNGPTARCDRSRAIAPEIAASLPDGRPASHRFFLATPRAASKAQPPNVHPHSWPPRSRQPVAYSKFDITNKIAKYTLRLRRGARVCAEQFAATYWPARRSARIVSLSRISSITPSQTGESPRKRSSGQSSR